MRRAVGAAVASLVLLTGGAGVAQATERYASPGGSGVACTQAQPCSLAEAVGAAKSNDEVIVTAGTYDLSAAIVTPVGASNLFVHGEFTGPMPKLNVSASSAAAITPGTIGVRLSYLEMTNTAANAIGAFCVSEGSVERVRATASGSNAIGIAVNGKCTVRDSLIRASGKEAVAISGFLFGGAATALIRNVTAIASGTKSIGISSSYGEIILPGSYTLDVKNAIAQGELADLSANQLAFPGNIAISNSNFDTQQTTGSATITGGSNQSAPPLFLDAAGGDYRQAPSSPTIDAGVADQIGALDLDGNPRNLGAAPDIGAFELVPQPVSAPTPAVGTIQSLSLKPKVFRAVNAGGAILSAQRRVKKAPVGTTVTYFLSAHATVEFTVERATGGRRVGGKCRKATRANRDKRKCTLFRTVKPSFTHFGVHDGVAPGNSFKFSGRLGGKALRPGKYRLTAKAGGALKRKRFQIVR